jgi:hypothetical protein
MQALRSDAEKLTILKFGLQAEGYDPGLYGCVSDGCVQPGQIAVEQIRRALERHSQPKPLPGDARPVRQRWLVEPDMHAAIRERARTHGLSVSDLVARMVRPNAPTTRGLDPAGIGNQFFLPHWLIAMLRDWTSDQRRASRARRTERIPEIRTYVWPWRASGLPATCAKSAYLQWVLQNHPDKGGSHDVFVRGKDDYERLVGR